MSRINAKSASDYDGLSIISKHPRGTSFSVNGTEDSRVFAGKEWTLKAMRSLLISESVRISNGEPPTRDQLITLDDDSLTRLEGDYIEMLKEYFGQFMLEQMTLKHLSD